MRNLDPWRFGVALAMTIAVGYTVRTAIWLLFPGPSIDFVNAQFHGLEFRRLHVGGAFAIGSWLIALAVLTAWAFLIGTLVCFVVNRLGTEHDNK
jgi:hypothetical protein